MIAFHAGTPSDAFLLLARFSFHNKQHKIPKADYIPDYITKLDQFTGGLLLRETCDNHLFALYFTRDFLYNQVTRIADASIIVLNTVAEGESSKVLSRWTEAQQESNIKRILRDNPYGELDLVALEKVRKEQLIEAMRKL